MQLRWAPGSEEHQPCKAQGAAASIAEAAGGELVDLMYLQGDCDMAALLELPTLEAASGLLKSVTDSGVWEGMMMFSEFDRNTGLASINAGKSGYKAPDKD